MSSHDTYFRAGVGVLVIDGDGRVLALERSDRPGSWQAPQGGIEEGESPIDAAARELEEETGLAWEDVTLLSEADGWLTYELPVEARSEKTGRGQTQKWFLVRYDGESGSLTLGDGETDREFLDWTWVEITDLIERTWNVRRPVYHRLAIEWGHHLA